MKFRLESNRVEKLNIETLHTPDKQKENSLKMDYKLIFPDEDSHTFIIRFSYELSDAILYKISGESQFVFRTDEAIDQDFRNSEYPYINAPAVAYPYLRSFISFITLNSGFAPAILPTLNFVEFGRTKISQLEK